jgi:DNA-binding SARP family transcriptional activator
LIRRLAEIADSRYTTQIAVVADCQAALHTIRGDFAEARLACDRFMTAIEAANEPPLERWPHFITKFQVLLAEGHAEEAADFLTDLLPLFTGALRQRMDTCVLLARACRAKRAADPDYPQLLRRSFEELRIAGWPAILLNVPELLSALCADALDFDIEPELCRSLIARRALVPPRHRPARWPWPLRLHVLGEFHLDRDGALLELGPKPPTRSLEILRGLALSKNHVCSLQQLYDWLWPDAEGDQAKAACEQALHRLRRLLGRADFLVQRGGKLRLDPEKVWVDLDEWQARLERVLENDPNATTTGAAMRAAVWEFPGPAALGDPPPAWAAVAEERLRSRFIEVAMRLGNRFEADGNVAQARETYLRALEAYATSERCAEALRRLPMGRNGSVRDS